jgi:hypothetical protein
LQVSGTVVSASGELVIQTSKGNRYLLRIPSSVQIATERENLTLTWRDVPVGARVRVVGVLQSDGSLRVTEISVRLPSVTIRGSVLAMGTRTLSVETGGTQVTVRLSGTTTIVQGSHSLTSADVVVGDDVTVYGYEGQKVVLARKVLVHRRLVGTDGTVSSLSAGGFVLDAADGPHQVLLSDGTVITGGTTQDLAVGMTVHVTGYLRGDGSILATRLRLGKK